MQSNTIYYLCTHIHIVKVRKHEGKDAHSKMVVNPGEEEGDYQGS